MKRPRSSVVLQQVTAIFILTGAASPAKVLGQAAGGSAAGSQISSMTRLTLVVSVRETNGQPLGVQAIVRVTTDLSGQNIMDVTREGAVAAFPNMTGGDYVVDVEAVGYKTAHERAELVGGSSSTVYVYMVPEGTKESVEPVNTQPIMTPKLQKEIERGREAIRDKKYAEARQHLLAASKLSPAIPEVEYLLGMVDYIERNLETAVTHFEKTLALSPSDERAMVSLGQVQLETHEYGKAASHLEKAVQLNSKNSQAHLLLAVCDVNLHDFVKARSEALAAAAQDANKAPTGHMIAAKTYLMEKNLQAATRAFTEFVRDYPNDKSVPEANSILERLSKMTAPPSSVPVEVPASHAPAPAEIDREWAPSDIDEKLPAVASDVACSTVSLVEHTQRRSQLALDSFERFGATEQIEHQEIDGSGNPGPVKSRNFSYIILIERPNPNFYYIDERRDGGEASFSFPTSLATRGLVSLGVYLFHPTFSQDFNYSCEGLGRWAGRPAWQLRFEQKSDVASRIRSWSAHGKFFPVALKGRVWISPNTFDILHLETDLREPVRELKLTREHISIEYGPVKFKQTKEELWLPVSAEMYFSIFGKRYHHKHTLSDYVLFSVNTHHKPAAPAPQVE